MYAVGSLWMHWAIENGGHVDILRFILREGRDGVGEWADFEFWILSLGIHGLPLGTNYDLSLKLMNDSPFHYLWIAKRIVKQRF